MLNQIIIMGRLTRDPELRRTNSGMAVANFCVADQRDFPNSRGEKETDFIDCVAWNTTGEFVSKYFTKGSMIVASGRLQIRPWTDKNGNQRRAAEVIVEKVYFGESKRSGEDNGNSYGGSNHYGPAPGNYAAPPFPGMSDFAPLEDDDAQLPF